MDPQPAHSQIQLPRAQRWRLRTQTLQLGRRPRLMGIVNVTPDSFSDGGRFAGAQAAIDHALSLVDQGADILDIGGESTRPYSQPVSAEEELRRVLPVLEGLRGRMEIPLSIDTSKACVAREAIDRGAEIINDVTGLEGDPEMIRVALETGAAVCAMHMRGAPQTMQDEPTYQDVVAEIRQYLCARRDSLLAAGIEREKICLDPGIGFGKTHAHNLELIQNCWQFHACGCPLLVGHSRKGFIGKLVGEDLDSRDAGTLGFSLALANQGVQILRIHAVGQTRAGLIAQQAASGAME